LKPNEAPRLYSGCFGLGSRDLQPEALIGAVENMLPEGKRRKFFYLSVDFLHDHALNPKQEIHQQQLADAYPHIAALAVHGSENPNLMPKGSVTVRIHSVGGWGAITTGKNLAMTLYDLLGYEIKANPKYGSEKKGQPTTYYLSAAPEPIRVNCEYHYVDVVMSPDPNVFEHSNPLAGLDRGGVFIIQSDLDAPDKVWARIPRTAQQFILDHDIRVFYVDGFRIAREEARDPELQFRMQGNAFQGAFFAASPLMKNADLTEETLFKAIEDQLTAKFGAKGKRVVEDNLRVVRRGFTEAREITAKSVASEAVAVRRDPGLPVMLTRLPHSGETASDIQRFWEQTGNFYRTGLGAENLADPFAALSLIPAATGVYRDMTQIRFEYPKWLPDKCTACGDCYAACPDSAIPGLVNSVSEIFDTAIRRVEMGGNPTLHLRRYARIVEKKLRGLIEPIGDSANVNALLDRAVLETLAESGLEGDAKARLEKEFGLFMEALGGFKFATTRPYWTTREKKAKGSGGLFSITINPYTCKGCMECVTVCDDHALEAVKQTPEAVERLKRDWNLWLELPTTAKEFIRIDDLDERVGALETLLLDKRNYESMVCGDGACLGCGEKTAIHLFTATVTALMQPRVKKHIAYLDELIARLETHVRLRLADSVDLSNVTILRAAADTAHGTDLTLARLAERLDTEVGSHPIDPDWLTRATGLLETLRSLRWRYADGVSHRGRAGLGFINATGCTSVWGSTYPYNPYPFPWTSHLFQDSPSVAMGVFEGHMAKMAEGFKAIRLAELELKGEYNAATHEPQFARFNWQDFSDDELRLCPPVVAVGGDGAMYDIGFQNLSRMLMSGRPIKVLVLDTQVYSNTGGQACTSGFVSQVSDMAPYGKRQHGKTEERKEISLIAMAHRTAYVLQGSVAHLTHLIEGFIEGMNSRRPALFNLYATCQPEHGVADDATFRQSRLAVDARAYPLVRYNPDAGDALHAGLSLEGNPAPEDDWVRYPIRYLDDDGKEATLDTALTFADFAITEGRFRKHFKKAPRATWNDDMVPLVEFLEAAPDERAGRFPYIWALDDDRHLTRVLVSQELVHACEERRRFWRQLKGIAGLDRQVDTAGIAQAAREDMAQKLTQSLMALAASGGATGGLTEALSRAPGDRPAATAAAGAAPADYEPVWIDTPQCTACDECTEINPRIFAYNDEHKVVVRDARGGPYKDIVRAAEKCTAGVIHPGTPFNRSEPGLEKLMQRAAKYQ
jgi:pyruvate-ferredoxin/flavodoxin oxidoreductase